MTTFVIVFNCICLAWCLSMGIVFFVKKHKQKKKALRELKDYESEKSVDKVEE